MHSTSVLAAVLTGANLAFAITSTTRPAESTIEPATASIAATQATQAALSPMSDVKGAGFDRIIQIWLENTVIETHQLFTSVTDFVSGLWQSCGRPKHAIPSIQRNYTHKLL